MDGRTGGRVGGRTDGRTDDWTDGRTGRRVFRVRLFSIGHKVTVAIA